jgi:hypothetical protein
MDNDFSSVAASPQSLEAGDFLSARSIEITGFGQRLR